MVGKAIFDECLLECYFVKSLYKIMTGEALCFSDLEDFDNAFYNNMKWCLENDVECLMTTFVAETDYFGKPLEVELIENGKNITVSNSNKRDYVEKLCFFKLYSEI
jgi:E3 ubiquitin-protein ligase HUWE1